MYIYQKVDGVGTKWGEVSIKKNLEKMDSNGKSWNILGMLIPVFSPERTMDFNQLAHLSLLTHSCTSQPGNLKINWSHRPGGTNH